VPEGQGARRARCLKGPPGELCKGYFPLAKVIVEAAVLDAPGVEQLATEVYRGFPTVSLFAPSNSPSSSPSSLPYPLTFFFTFSLQNPGK